MLSAEIVVLVAVLATIGAASSAFQWTRTIDDVLYDRAQRLFAPEVPDDLVVVAIDERSLRARGRWPWPRNELAALIDRLAAAQVRAVAVDIVLADSTSGEHDSRLASAIQALPIVVLPVFIDALTVGGVPVEIMPIPRLAELADLGHVHVEFDADGVARGIYLYQGVGDAHWPHFSLALAHALGEAHPREAIRPDGFTMRRVRDDYRRVPFPGAAGNVAHLSALDVLENDSILPLLAGMTVFVGVIATAADDAVVTPLTGAERPMSGVELNANVYSAIRSNALITPLGAAWHLGLTMFLCIAAPIILPRLNPRWSLGTTLVLSAIPILGSMSLLATGTWFAPLSASLVILATYPLWSWRRLDYAFRYLTDDLGSLEAEADQLPVDTENRDLARSLEFLAQLHGFEGWGIYGTDGVERRTGSAPASCPAVEVPGQWQYSNSGAWLRVTDTDTTCVIGLIAPRAVLESPEVRRSLTHMRDTFVERRRGRRGAYEAIGALLRRLARTSSRVGVLRRVVVDTMSHMGDGLLLVDGFGQVTLANEKAASLARANSDTFIGLPFWEALANLRLAEGQWIDIARACFVEGDRVEVNAESASGASLLVHAARIDLGQPVGQGMIVNLVDITALREAERGRSETLAFLSHDLRSPMVSLLALVKRHRERADDTSDQALLDSVETYARRNLDASDKFLQLARLQTSEDVEFYDFEVTNVMDNAVEQLYFQAEDKGVVIEVASNTEYPDGIWVRGNAELLERALINLVDNAIKYSPAGSRITTSTRSADGHVVLEVHDQGDGIPLREQGSLFELYYRVPGRSARRERGSGLGLPFVKAVAERHGGRVEIESQPGAGSTFRIVLPTDPMV